MSLTPQRTEIDYLTIKLIVGVMALSLAGLTSFFSDGQIASISESYYRGGWAQSTLIGFLYATAAFLLAYNGLWRSEMVLSKVASIAALGVALFPCRCGDHIEIIPYVHAVSAATLFLILAYFCYAFFQRAMEKGHTQAKARAVIYALCGSAIVLSIVAIAVYNLPGGTLKTQMPRLTFYGESVALIAFGFSWLTASRVLPWLTREDERFKLL